MASETLEEKKAEKEALVEGTAEREEEEEEEEEGKAKEGVEEKPEDKEENLDVPEKDGNEELQESKGQEEEEKVEEAEEEVKQEAKSKKAAKKGGRKGVAKKEQSKSKKSKQESSEEKLNKEKTEKKEKEKGKDKGPMTPASERPTRERKIVERYSVPELGRSATKPLSIQKGSGTQLKDIPNVAFKLSKRKPDDNLQMLHTILFGKKAKVHNLKRNIGQFSGYVWAENEHEKQKAKVREKLDKCVKEKLIDFCDVLNIPINKAAVRKEELTVKILEFLESPHTMTDALLADKEQKSKKHKVSVAKSVSPGEKSAIPAKKPRQMPQSGKKRKRLAKHEVDAEYEDGDKLEVEDTKDESQDEEGNTPPKDKSDHEDAESEEDVDAPKGQTSAKKPSSKKTVKDSSVVKSKEKFTPGKKSTLAKSAKSYSKSTKKSSASSSKQGAKDNDGTSTSPSKSKGTTSKKQKVEKESPKDQSVPKSSAKGSRKAQGKAKSRKRGKSEPSRKEMQDVVVDILKEVDFNTATLSDILRQLGSHFGVDLMHRKAEVKAIITDVINNMSEDEDEGEEEEDNAEAGDDADKDGDGDDSDT